MYDKHCRNKKTQFVTVPVDIPFASQAPEGTRYHAQSKGRDLSLVSTCALESDPLSAENSIAFFSQIQVSSVFLITQANEVRTYARSIQC